MLFKVNGRRLFWILIAAGLLLGAGRLAEVKMSQAPGSAIVISEFMASNSSGLMDEDGDYSDWIELYNPGPGPVNLAGWALTDDPDDPEKWTLPDISLGGEAYLLVFASGKDRRPPEAGAPLHTNFKLDKEGEFLALYHILDDKLYVAAESGAPQFRDITYGRYGSGTDYGYLAAATPGQANNSELLWQDVTAEVSFSMQRGFYETPFRLELTTETPGATIYYTLDGSEPAENGSPIYQEPLLIDQTTLLRAAAYKANSRPSAVTTHSFIFLDEVLSQPPNPAGWPESWGVYRQTYKVAVEGEAVPTDYEMDPEIVNDPRYRNTIKDDLKSIPSLSIVFAPQDFDIYINPRQRGKEWERPASIELIDPAEPERTFQVNAGLRIQGDIGREEYIPKHSFRLFFRNEYGPGELEYPLFPGSPVESFDTLILRGGVQSSYVSVWTPRRRNATYTRDEWLRASQIEMSGIGSHGIFVHLYLNGLYWGLYNLVERPDETFGAAYFKVDTEDWYAFNHDGIVNGSQEEVQQLFYNFINTADPEEKYRAIKPYLDTAAFADYLILNWYAGTGDWPENNWYAGMPRSGGQLRYFIWDGELTWRDGARIHLGAPNLPGYLWPNTVELMFKALIQNPDFKIELADRLYKHLFNDGALTDANAQARWQALNRIIDRAIVGETARWGDTREETPLNREDWLAAVERVLAQMDGNAGRLIALAREAGYYPEIDPPLFNRPGGYVENGFELTLSLPSDQTGGAIYFTTDGTDPRTPGTGEVSPGAGEYRAPLPLTATTQVKARVLADNVWSALAEATFSFEAAEPGLRITEIMYHPAGQDDYEFIELKNSGRQAVDLAGMAFEGIDFAFPEDAVLLPPGQFVVLARNPTAFSARYPDIPIFGSYDGQLSNKGETITLKDRHGQPLISISYDDDNGWPLSPDGRGDSLVFTNPDGDPNDPKNWQASASPNGSPGRDDGFLAAQ